MPYFRERRGQWLLGSYEAPPGSSLDHLQNIFRLFDPETGRYLPAEKGLLSCALRGEIVDGAEYTVRDPRGGGPQWIECGARPTREPGGEITGAVITFRNVDERKKQQLAVEAAARLSTFIYDENLAGIIRATVDGRILECNDAILRMLGYASKQELLAVRALRSTTTLVNGTACCACWR